jgi:ergothioneine biosynthesis protein EgtB
LKHGLGLNPLRPAYSAPLKGEQAVLEPVEWLSFPAGVRWIGHQGPGFAFDNEMPRHRVFVGDFAIAARPVASGEYLEFIEAGGYDRPEFWLSDGWAARQRNGWTSPQYWARDGRDWSLFTLQGERPLDPAEPVCHVSYYEADAFARWAGARLPTEAEWETAVAEQEVSGHFLDSGGLHPAYSRTSFFGDVWVWTASSYLPYPGFKPAAGAVGEYNGKFMCNQMVLRGGSCATPAGHIRRTYRNFFPPEARWQFSGLRLARDDSA